MTKDEAKASIEEAFQLAWAGSEGFYDDGLVKNAKVALKWIFDYIEVLESGNEVNV